MQNPLALPGILAHAIAEARTIGKKSAVADTIIAGVTTVRCVRTLVMARQTVRVDRSAVADANIAGMCMVKGVLPGLWLQCTQAEDSFT